jgi:hypothetical protein
MKPDHLFLHDAVNVDYDCPIASSGDVLRRFVEAIYIR